MDIKGDGVGSDKTVDKKHFSHGEMTCRGFLWPVQYTWLNMSGVSASGVT